MIPAPAYNLTDIESQILALMVQDRARKVRDISCTLNISSNYFYHLVRQMRLKFCVQNNAALVARAIQEGVISPDGNLAARPKPIRPLYHVSQPAEAAMAHPHADKVASHPDTVN